MEGKEERRTSCCTLVESLSGLRKEAKFAAAAAADTAAAATFTSRSGAEAGVAASTTDKCRTRIKTTRKTEIGEAEAT